MFVALSASTAPGKRLQRGAQHLAALAEGGGGDGFEGVEVGEGVACGKWVEDDDGAVDLWRRAEGAGAGL